MRKCDGARILVLCLMALLAFPLVASTTPEDDLDADGLPDQLEQELLERFLPTFYVSAGDCDVSPSRFAPGSVDPRPIDRDGTIYGQAFPAPAGPNGPRIELHFYHLWGKDCGRFSHSLDVEHVAALVELSPAVGVSDARAADGMDSNGLVQPKRPVGPNPQRQSTPVSASKGMEQPWMAGDGWKDAEGWRWVARYWFAAGHESTVCDVSHAAKAPALLAEHVGPEVWISTGKHASYLALERCRFGCGGDTCPDMQRLRVAGVINVGEQGAPLNGSTWIASKRWPFTDKLASRFPAVAIARIDAAKPESIVAVNEALPPVRATILAGGETLDGMATGGRHTGDAIRTGHGSTENALGKAAESTGGALRKSVRAVHRALGGSASPPEKAQNIRKTTEAIQKN